MARKLEEIHGMDNKKKSPEASLKRAKKIAARLNKFWTPGTSPEVVKRRIQAELSRVAAEEEISPVELSIIIDRVDKWA